MYNITISMWVNSNDEFAFFSHLKIIDSLSIDNTNAKSPYTWRTADIKISKSMISNWTQINIPYETYLKFRASWNYNTGTFTTDKTL